MNVRVVLFTKVCPVARKGVYVPSSWLTYSSGSYMYGVPLRWLAENGLKLFWRVGEPLSTPMVSESLEPAADWDEAPPP